MTLSLAWVREVNDTRELVFATDSRLRFGQAWDCCPKILSLPRSDCLICFAGATEYAYPLMLQMQAAIGVYPKSRSRAMRLSHARGHVVRVFNHMRTFIHDLPQGQDQPGAPDVRFIFGGYDWSERDFRIWELHYDKHIGRFTFRPASFWKGIEGNRRILLMGDHVDGAKERLLGLLEQRGKLKAGSFDMEPFEVLRDIIRGQASHYIGGPPQVAKVYEHLNSLHFAVRWPSSEAGQVAVHGRPLLPYERPDCPILDPDTLAVTWD